MNKSLQVICKSFFKSESEEERKKGLNDKWVQIIHCSEQKTKSSKYDIINNASQSFVSANLEKEEWNKR